MASGSKTREEIGRWSVKEYARAKEEAEASVAKLDRSRLGTSAGGAGDGVIDRQSLLESLGLSDADQPDPQPER